MNYLNYTTGGVARVSDKPCLTLPQQIQTEDINLLSRVVCQINNHLLYISRLEPIQTIYSYAHKLL